jgi:peptide chain release factor subunit 1
MSAQLTATKPRRHHEPERANAPAELVPNARTLDRIARVHGEGLPVVSAYLAVHPGPDGRRALRTKADSLLHRIRSLADDRSLDHNARMSLRADIEEVKKIARTEIPRRGTLAIFACSRAGVLELVRLPRPVRDRIMVDATPWIAEPDPSITATFPSSSVAR